MRTPTTHWQLGNTGFRNPARLWALARVVHALPMAFRDEKGGLQVDLLKDAISVAKADDPETLKGLMGLGQNEELTGLQKGLKALTDFGFLNSNTAGLGDDVFTPLGRRFVNAKTDRARRLVFAESLAKQAPQEVRGTQGRVLERVAQIWVEMVARQGKDAFLHREDITWCVLPTSFDTPAAEVVDTILAERAAHTRRNRPKAEPRKAKLAREKARLEQLGWAVSAQSARGYADVTMRHLLFTGLFHPDSSTINLRHDEFWMPAWQALARGQTELWENEQVNQDLRRALLLAMNQPASKNTSLLELLEARDQKALAGHMQDPQMERVAGDMFDALQGNTSKCRVTWHDDTDFPIGELGAAAACAEWAATTVMVQALRRDGEIDPNEGWKGRADAQGRPERYAAGRAADAWVTGRCRWVIEATLLTNSRQEACEGESVRRHVSDHRDCGKPVWGIFTAPKIDYNTLSTLASGVFFEAGQAHKVRVIPFSFEQMATLHRAKLRESDWESLCEAIWEGRPQGDLGEVPAKWEALIAQQVQTHAQPVKKARQILN